ncbi:MULTISPECIES: DinB family protein [Actinoplanes]|uniref:DinB family protein n=1 Tax=Actinoplanes TaxID=1865 RepID=UPI0005F28D88|nr:MULTISPECIES: DinB family protein [Actinoplanes]GLY03732.1 hypothetical protein Acsp01_41110 [Actinoplanes sp. NBRC 101535]
MSDDDRPRFVGTNLNGAQFIGAHLSGVVMRDVVLHKADIDSPWLFEDGNTLLVNGVDVLPFVDAELDRRFPGRERRRATDPDGLRAAWASLSRTWESTLTRVDAMPPGTADATVNGGWSFAQTLRHLVMATDTWFRGAVQRNPYPYHPIGIPNGEFEADGYDMSVFSHPNPTYAEVLAVRAERFAMVGDFLSAVTALELASPRRHPWAPEDMTSVLSCVHTILNEEWDHLRYAVRDLDALTTPPLR